LKEKVEALKKASMKIGEAMYGAQSTGTGGGDSGDGTTEADTEEVKDGDKR